MQKLLNIQNTLNYKKDNTEKIRNLTKLLNDISIFEESIEDIENLNRLLDRKTLKEPGYKNYINDEIKKIFEVLQKKINEKIKSVIDKNNEIKNKILGSIKEKNNQVEKIYTEFNNRYKVGGTRRYTSKNQKIKNNITKRFR